MADARHQRISELFEALRNLPPEARERQLSALSPEDRALADDLRSLLARHDDAGSFLARTPLEVRSPLDAWLASPADAARDDRAPGDVPRTFGEYTIVGLLGAGGMGIVYRAEQAHPRRMVALKVLQPGLATPAMLRRFEHEAQTLARLQHPGIAQIYEAASADAGAGVQPYFAMELVDGLPLSEWARGRSLREKLELLLQLCAAIQHAHQHGVVHRDLKPANVLVDASGRAKVLDFGVARSLAPEVHALTQLTERGVLVGTLPYMSPEQVAADGGAIDARTDVYALGVILFELLSGALPIEVRSMGLLEAAQRIRHTPPALLSSYGRAFRGDLETIAGKALEKLPERRYASVAELAADVERHLRHEPILARPASTVYHLTKFARRHGTLAAAAGAVVLALGGGAVVAWSNAREARAERSLAVAAGEREHAAASAAEVAAQQADTARRQADLQSARALGLFELVLQTMAGTHRGRTYSVADAIQTIAPDLERRFEGMPETQVALLNGVGEGFLPLEMHAEAERAFERAAAIGRAHLGADHAGTIRAEGGLVILEADSGDPAVVEPRLRELLSRARLHAAEDPKLIASVWRVLGSVLYRQSRMQDARAELEACSDFCAQTIGLAHPLAASVRRQLASVLRRLGEFEETERICRDVLERCGPTLGDDHAILLGIRNELALALAERGNWPDAVAEFERILPIYRRDFGDATGDALTVAENLGIGLARVGRRDEAVALLRECVAARRAASGAMDGSGLFSLDFLGGVLSDAGRLDEAEVVLREAWAARRALLGEDNLETVVSELNVAVTLLRLGRPRDAQPLAEHAIRAREAQFPPDHPDALMAHNVLGQILLASGERDAGLLELRTCADGLRRAIGLSAPNCWEAYADVVKVLADAQRFEEVESLCRELLETRAPGLADPASLRLRLRAHLATALRARGHLDEAADVLAAAEREFTRASGAGTSERIELARRRAEIELERGRAAEALEHAERALELCAKGSDAAGSSPPELALVHARALLALGRHDDVERELHALRRDLEARPEPSAELRASLLAAYRELARASGRTYDVAALEAPAAPVH